jgi:porin
LEIGWLPTFGGEFDGSYKFGGWYNSSSAPDVVENTNGRPLAIAGGEPLSCEQPRGRCRKIAERAERGGT